MRVAVNDLFFTLNSEAIEQDDGSFQIEVAPGRFREDGVSNVRVVGAELDGKSLTIEVEFLDGFEPELEDED